MKTLFNAIFTYRVNIIYTYFHCISPVYSNECGALLKRCTETNILLIGLFFLLSSISSAFRHNHLCVYKKNVTITKKLRAISGWVFKTLFLFVQVFWERLLCVSQIQRFFQLNENFPVIRFI